MASTLAHPTYRSSPLRLVWRSLAAGLAYIVSIISAGAAQQALGIPVPESARQIEPATALVGSFVSGVVMTLVLGPLAGRLALPVVEASGVLFVLIFVLNSFLSMVEAVFFTAFITSDQLLDPSNVVPALILAVLVAWLFRPAVPQQRLLPALGAMLARRRPLDWAWRFAAAGLIYVPIYLFFGRLVAPVAAPFYRDAGSTWGLILPGFDVILPLEVARGLAFVLAVFPLVALLPGSWSKRGLWIGLVIAALGSWAPLLGSPLLPPTLRVVHGIEITADAFVHGLAIAWLLVPRSGTDRAFQLSSETPRSVANAGRPRT